MAIRIDTDLQAVYIHEPLGHEVPALNTAWSVAGLFRLESDVNLNTLIVALYGTTAAANWVGLYMNSDGITCQLEGYNGGSPTVSGSYTLEVGREYRLAIDYNGAGTVRMLLDGVVVLSMSFTPNPGTPGERSLQWGGYGEVTGFTDCTIARWRMWTAVLTEAEYRREFRSTVPNRTRNLIHDWPMEAGSGRFNDTLSGEPDLMDNPLVPCGDGSEIYLRATPLGTPQFFSLGETATPGALTLDVPRWADRVVVHVAWSSNSVATFNVASISGNFCGTFVATENEDNLTTSVGVAVFHAEVQITGTGRSLTIALDAGSPLAGANCWVSFMQDVDRSSPVSAMDTGHAGTGGTVPGTTSVSVVAPAMVVALDARLSETTGGYATTESGWTSIGTNETTGTYAYFLCSRLRQYAADSGPVSATTQDTFASAIVSIAFQSAAMATVAPTAPLPIESNVVESGNNTASTSWAVSHPAAVAGDMLLFHLAWDDSTTVSSVTAPSGPNGETATSIAGPVASNSTEIRIQAWRYIATGSWSASTRTFTPAASEQWTAAVLKIPAGEFDASTPIGAASTAASAGAAETAVLSPAYSLGSTDGGGRLISFLAADDDPFTGFAAHWSTHSNVDRGAVAGLLASRDFETTNSESAAAGTWNIAGDSWASLAYVVRKAATGATDLATANASHGHTAENVVLTTSTTLAIDSATHAHSAGALTLSTGTSLVVADASHAHAADSLTLSTGISLVTADSAHAHTAQSLTLTTDSTLAVANASHAHAAGAAVLTTDSTLEVASATHGHTAENLTLDTALSVDLVISSASHAHSAQSLTLATASTTLAVDGATHGHTAGALALTLDTTLATANAVHAHAADNVTLSTTGGTFLTVADAVHAHTAGNAALTTDSTLAIQGATHAHSAETVGLSQAVALTVANASHAHAATNVALSVAPGLLIADATHAHIAGSPVLSIEAWLATADAWHAQLADTVTLSGSAFYSRAPSGSGYQRTTQVNTYRPSTGTQTARPTR